MKKTLLVLAFAPLFSASVFAAGYTGPGAAPLVNTVAMALDAKDDTPVVLEGQIVQRLKGDTYSFRDASGTINVDIDDEDLPATELNEHTRVRLMGEVDRNLMSREIDVEYVEVLAQ
jgi:uncharacterized protein (TIGR00156 family)